MPYNIYTPPPKETGILFIYDRDVNLLGEINRYSSLAIERSLYGLGSFSLTTYDGVNGLEHMIPGNFLSLGNSDSRVGLIGAVRVASGESGADVVEVSGFLLKGIAAMRTIVPPTQAQDPNAYGWEYVNNSPAENVLRHYFAYSLVNPRDLNRTLPRLAMEDAATPLRGPSTPWYATREETLPDVLASIGEWTGYGWDVRLDIPNKRLVYATVPLRDLTLGPQQSAPAVFSRDMGNIGSYSYSLDMKEYTNQLYIGGDGEYQNQLVITRAVDEDGNEVAESWTAWDRREAYISGGNISDIEKLSYEGLHRYNDTGRRLERLVEAEIIDVQGMRYGVDWDIGDRVTVLLPNVLRRSVRLDTQVISVEESYASGPPRITVRLGTELPTLRQEITQLKVTGGR